MRVYISGKITGNNNYIKEFTEREITLRSMGHQVCNPVKISKALEEKLGRMPSYDEYLQEDLKALDDCDAINMLDNWKDSKGANIERNFAIERNKVFIQVHVLSRTWD